MMGAQRSVDGISRILSKSDTERVKAPSIRALVLEAEQLEVA
jgi:hypothetical protein